MATVDYTPCECPACRRARTQIKANNTSDRGTVLDALVIAFVIVAGVAVALALKGWLT